LSFKAIIAGALVAVACGSAVATSSLSFEASGHVLDFEIGDTDRPVVAGVMVSMPGREQPVMLRPPLLSVEIFDPKKRILIVRFKNPGDPALPPGFSFAAHRRTGVLRTEGASFKGAFRWER
jgi:hypothetical protein